MQTAFWARTWQFLLMNTAQLLVNIVLNIIYLDLIEFRFSSREQMASVYRQQSSIKHKTIPVGICHQFEFFEDPKND